MSEWIKHDGNGMPVSGEERVFVKFKDGRNAYFQSTPFRAGIWGDAWVRLGRNYDIMEYSLVKDVNNG